MTVSDRTITAERCKRAQRISRLCDLCDRCVIVASVFWPRAVLSHGTLTTTVLFDREIVRILDKHCVMCHVEGGPSFPLETYEQTWVQGRQIRARVLARHMPPWGAVPGYGQFINDNSLTLRETQFIVSWVEGLGPRNAGTVFTNVADSGATAGGRARARPIPATGSLEIRISRASSRGTPSAPEQANEIKRTVVDLGLTSERRVSALEYMPGDRRVVRAAFFTVQETGQWIGSWTPWYGMARLPAGSAYRLPAGSHIVAEIHYRGANEAVEDRGHDRPVLRRPTGAAIGDGPGARSGRPGDCRRRRAEAARRDEARGRHLRPGAAAGDRGRRDLHRGFREKAGRRNGHPPVRERPPDRLADTLHLHRTGASTPRDHAVGHGLLRRYSRCPGSFASRSAGTRLQALGFGL